VVGGSAFFRRLGLQRLLRDPCALHGFSFATSRFEVPGEVRINAVKAAQLDDVVRAVPVPGFSLGARLKSFVYAGRGIRTMLVSQHNAWIHAAATGAAVVAGFALRLGRFECLALVLAIVSVWTAEALNTAFEFLCDVASPEFHPLVERAKDVAAGAVLICAVGAVVTAAFVFAPHLAIRTDRAPVQAARAQGTWSGPKDLAHLPR